MSRHSRGRYPPPGGFPPGGPPPGGFPPGGYPPGGPPPGGFRPGGMGRGPFSGGKGPGCLLPIIGIALAITLIILIL